MVNILIDHIGTSQSIHFSIFDLNVTQGRSQVSPFELVLSDSLVADFLPKLSDLSIAETNVSFKASVKRYFLAKSS